MLRTVPVLVHSLKRGAPGIALLAGDDPLNDERPEVQVARESGWAYSEGEVIDGMASVAALSEQLVEPTAALAVVHLSLSLDSAVVAPLVWRRHNWGLRCLVRWLSAVNQREMFIVARIFSAFDTGVVVSLIGSLPGCGYQVTSSPSHLVDNAARRLVPALPGAPCNIHAEKKIASPG